MEPEFLPGDRVWFDRSAYRVVRPSAGEVVVLHDPDGSGRLLLKAVAASGPSTVWVGREGVVVAPPGTDRDAVRPADLLEEVAVADGQLFVTSRRLTGTRDSRSFGPVALSLVLGQVWFRYAPVERRGPVGPTRGSRPS